MSSHKCHCSIHHRDRPSLSGKWVQEGGSGRERERGDRGREKGGGERVRVIGGGREHTLLTRTPIYACKHVHLVHHIRTTCACNLYPSHTYQGVSRWPFHSRPQCTLQDTDSSLRHRFLHSGSVGSQQEEL